MSTGFFGDVTKIEYEGPDSTNPLAFRHYKADEMVMGKRMEDHLRFAVAYWHSFAWTGTDPFGGDTFQRPWFPADSMELCKLKADVAFEMFSALGNPFYCFHDADVRPEGANFAENTKNLEEIVDYFAEKQEATGVKLLWGTANVFSHPRYMNGASTNPDFNVVTHAAAQVKAALDATVALGGRNYVFWGGREGYACLFNTDAKRELEHMGRFLGMDRPQSARFSMLMSIPAILISGAVAVLEIAGGETTASAGDAIIVVILSFIAGWLAIYLFMRMTERMSFTPFVIYRFVFGAVLIAVARM